MKQFSFTLLFAATLLLFTGCSKDIFKPYEKRIVGTWRISDIYRNGFGGNTGNLPFQEAASFTFNSDGTLRYTSATGLNYSGTWNIEENYRDNETYKTLVITVVNFSTQQVITEYYSEMNFSGTDHFVARIYEGLHTYVTHFRR